MSHARRASRGNVEVESPSTPMLHVPKRFIEKIATHFDKVQRAWLQIRKKIPKDQVMSTKQFYELCDKQLRIGLNDKEIKELIACLDTDNSGTVSFEEFNAMLAPLLQPSKLQDQSTWKLEEQARGRLHHFNYDGPVSFNNKYRQTLDESGEPLLKNIFQSKFETTDMPESLFTDGKPRCEIVTDRPTGKKVGTASGLEFDRRRHVPMMQSVMEGYWYGDKPTERMKVAPSRDHLFRHRKTISDYSKVLRSIKPPPRKSPFPMSSSLSPPVQSSHRLSRSFEPVFPRSVGDISELYGREGGDSDAAETIVAYLEGAAPLEKQRFLRALQRADKDRAQLGGARSALSLAPFTANGHSPPRQPTRPGSVCSSGRHSLHNRALSDATAFARSRRPDTAHRPASVSLLPRPAARPTTAVPRPAVAFRSQTPDTALSAAGDAPREGGARDTAADAHGGGEELAGGEAGGDTAEGRARLGGWALDSPKMAASGPFGAGVRGGVPPFCGEKRMANRMHLDLQRAAFGATFNAKRLSQLKQQLHDNDRFALGMDGAMH